MEIDLDKGDLKSGVLGLVLALVEIIKETLEIQALKRTESGRLTEGEVERLGLALKQLDSAIEEIKLQCGAAESVREIRDSLDNAVNEVLNQFLDPGKWGKAAGAPLAMEKASGVARRR
ncbi:MAG: gas vesicle protein K [Thaumarchaeota archaeon]|nr:gas vesicle protein K [Nitrososphaerota archaeon]